MPRKAPQKAAGATKPVRLMTEHLEQVFLLKWAHVAVVQHPELVLLFAIPNGGQRDVRVAAKLKREGVKAGVPDLCLPVARGGFHSLYIEMKAHPNKPTDSQLIWHNLLRAQNHRVEVCYSWDSAREALLAYLALPQQVASP